MKIREKVDFNLKNSSIFIGVIIALVCGVTISIIIGINLVFIISLASGIILGSANTFFLNYFTKRALDRGKKSIVLLSCYLRGFVFLVIFYFAITQFGYTGGLGAALGYLSSYAGIMLSTLLMIKRNKANKNIDSDLVIDGDINNILIRDFDMTMYRNGRKFITYKMFNRMKEI